MQCRWLCLDGRALQLGLGVGLVVTSFFFFAACSPQYGSFLPANAHFTRTFGQLFQDGSDKKLSHFVIVKMPPGAIRTVTNGTMEYRPTFNELGNSVLVRAQKYPITLNDQAMDLAGNVGPFGAVQATP